MELSRQTVLGRVATGSTSTPQLPIDSIPSTSSSDEIPQSLFQFITELQTLPERPFKRRKLTQDQKLDINERNVRREDVNMAKSELDFIIVTKAVWEIDFAASPSSILGASLNKNEFRTVVHWEKNGGPQYIEFYKHLSKDAFFRATIPQDPKHFDEVLMSLQVDRDSKKWASGQGRLWTEFGLALTPKHGFIALRISFHVKWNVTTSPDFIAQANRTTKAVADVLGRYYPDTNVNEAETWTAKDFYESVCTAANTDEVSGMNVPGLEATLFPFQKRAVQFLLRSEGVTWSPEGLKQRSICENSELPISFIATKDSNNRPCYVSHLFGLVTLDVGPFQALQDNLRGGILAEEMGLGKTVEMISLISLHRRKAEDLTEKILDTFTGTTVRPTAATLIISPPSILQQWISEVNKHAPHLSVMHYKGIKGHPDLKEPELLDRLSASDVVVTTYSILAGEIHYTQLNGKKSLRGESKYPRPKSPLMLLSWFRVCIDEAQMIETGVSNAAVVARMIPRINAWCVSGTPVRKNVNDLLGLLVFLRYNPYANLKRIWSSLISSHKHDFRKLFGGHRGLALALRHSKQSVRGELKLPAQRRFVITMPFTPIEEQYYQELFNQMCEEAGLDSDGSPLTDDWDSDAVTDIMRTWLTRLRQTALHPEVGNRNRRALGQNDGAIRTVDQVLDVMMEQTDLLIRTDQRTLLTLKLKRGQLFENSPRVQEALAIWTTAVSEASEIVKDCRDQLQIEITKVQSESASKEPSEIAGTDDESSDEDENDQSSRLGVFRNRLRGALEIEHMAVFFQANAYFQIKTNVEMTDPESAEFQKLEKLETDGYERAKNLRQEILQDIYRKTDKLMRRLSKQVAAQTFVQIPELPKNSPSGGVEICRIVDQLNALGGVLDKQANILDEWRKTAIGFLLRSLVDEDHDGVELTGDEYENSTVTQDEVVIYVQALRAIIADRNDSLSGLDNALIAHDVKAALRVANKGEGPFPTQTLQLFAIRQEVKPTKEMGSLRGIISDLRGLATSLKPIVARGIVRAQDELHLVEKQLKFTQNQLLEQTKATTALEKELDLFITLMNTRLEYYRQLQAVSDMVGPYEGPNNEKVVTKMLENEAKMTKRIGVSKSKRRYLEHLRLEASNPQEQRICIICNDPFEIGALTVCGHQYCKECMGIWWNQHHNCPVCKRKLAAYDLHDITYKPQELSIQTEEVHDPAQERASPTKSRKSAIYSEISAAKLTEIKNIQLDGPSFTTKVDTLARHLIWLRETDPGAKSIIFSQYKDFLDVLAQAFQQHRIGFSSIDKPKGIQNFKTDPGVECFLLHARAHSSGLNLVNASHVFLCEPLLHTALELQAIARVDRIGQQQETNVWLYLVDGTVEESIHQLSVKRRMEHIGQTLAKGKGKARELSPTELIDAKLEEANSMELQQASLTGLLAKGGKGGEMVHKDDLWECLFGGGSGQRRAVRTLENSGLRYDTEVGRELRAGAAEERADDD